LKPLKYPGDPDPNQVISKCPECNGAISDKSGVPFCVNCNKTVDPLKGRAYPGKVPGRGERFDEFGPKDTVLPRSMSLGSKESIIIEAKKEDDDAEKNKKQVKDVFVSDEFQQCMNPKELRKRENVDYKEEVLKSCRDLAIDG